MRIDQLTVTPQTPHLSGEYRLLIDAASTDRSAAGVTGQLDWSRVLELARHHRLEALLHRHVKQAGIAVPDFVQERLHSMRERTLVGEMGARRQLIELAATMADARVRVVALKGGGLLDGVYPETGLRPMSDLDLLVGDERLNAAIDALTTAGYHRHRALQAPTRGGGHHHHHPLVRKDRWLAVELHSAPARSVTPRSGQALAARALPSPSGAYHVPTPADHLLVLAAHFMGDRESSSRAALGQLTDMAHVIAYTQLDWDAVVDTAIDWGVQTSAHPSLYAVSALGLAHVPSDALAALAPKSQSVSTAQRLVVERVLGDELGLVLRARIPRSARQWLFPGVDYLRRRYQRPNASAASLYWRRTVVGSELLVTILRHPLRAIAEFRFDRRLRGR